MIAGSLLRHLCASVSEIIPVIKPQRDLSFSFHFCLLQKHRNISSLSKYLPALGVHLKVLGPITSRHDRLNLLHGTGALGHVLHSSFGHDHIILQAHTPKSTVALDDLLQ